jgi:hypothetical protein
MIRKTAAALAVAAGFAAVIGIAGPAFAGTPGNGTPESDEIVLWRDSGFAGNVLYDAPAGTQTTPWDYTGTFRHDSSTPINNNVSSIANYTSHYGVAWTGAGATGASLILAPYNTAPGGTSWAYSSLGTYDDSFSSQYIV